MISAIRCSAISTRRSSTLRVEQMLDAIYQQWRESMILFSNDDGNDERSFKDMMI